MPACRCKGRALSGPEAEGRAASLKGVEEYGKKYSALVVIDLQNDITKNYKEIIEKVNKAIDWAVQKQLCVVYIQHNKLFLTRA